MVRNFSPSFEHCASMESFLRTTRHQTGPVCVQVFHGRPVGEVVREHHARPALALDEFRTAFHPVLFVEAHHEAGLVVERGVVAVDARLHRELAHHRQMHEMAVVGDVAVEGLAPEIGLALRAHGEHAVAVVLGCGRIEPGHAAQEVATGACRGSSRLAAGRAGMRGQRDAGRLLQEVSSGGTA